MPLCLCDASKKQAKERALDMEAATEKMIFFEEATGVQTEKVMRAYRRRRLVAARSTLLPRATVAMLSHGISYLLVDSFVSYYLVELGFHVSIPSSIPNKAFVSAKSQLCSTNGRHPSIPTHTDHVTKAAPTNIPF